MIFRHATYNDIPTLTSLLNRSYRGDSSRTGWTTEADLLSGKRIDETGILKLLNDPDSLILIAQSEESILATIHAHHETENVHFGLFAVEPSLQGGGIGKELLAYAESEAIRKWGVTSAIMEVITHRIELIEYYERRGYVRSGKRIAFPKSDLWDQKVDSLELSELSKRLDTIS
ncbi:MAG: GNAT family N-acetyltransferase [Sulfuricurvum sp. RIFOXYD2_FULL_44_160]|uniref:GNAT family N-acetyltransferase n=1 Tax=Sulfuricurvum kujiense TaxID=148813 RepID=A0A2D3WBD9_9BACT|nr:MULTISPECIES: GNAT family N-acetyltransferase [Sulfuricurvum]OHD93231.1 MAG: GNAT family N-acetyltransferase [Sulfuricurvum sp. RIFOXYD2_FULL_44_160]DAB37738.1 MAG TPA: GNAT family N-acetyltransferase [Sulfuricurvum kujiense]